MSINFLVRPFFVAVWFGFHGWAQSFSEPFYERWCSGACMGCSAHPGAWLPQQSTSLGSTWIHPGVHPTLGLSQLFSPQAAQPLLQNLSRGILTPFLISSQPLATVNNQNVQFLVRSLLANMVQPSSPSSLLQTPKETLPCENMSQHYDIVVITLLLSETHLFQGCACTDFSTKGASSRRALTVSAGKGLGV